MADYQRLLTVQDAVSRVLGSFGLPTPGSVFDSQDANVIQMRTLANDVGQELIGEAEWQVLGRDHTIVTDPLLTKYALPSDFDRYITDSQWNYTSRLPAVGSVSTQDWQALKARSLGGTLIATMFRIDQDQVELYATPPNSQTLVFPYVSRSWVRTSQGVFRDNVQSNDDTIMFDSALFRTALTLAWMTRKGMDTTDASQKFTALLSSAKGKDSPSSATSIVPGGGIPLLGVLNLPGTGYGTA
jgi:hypothetical protein